MEIEVMKRLNSHPNLVKLYEVIDDDENDKLYMSKSDVHNITCSN
jgi:serine/threonine protein kinase